MIAAENNARTNRYWVTHLMILAGTKGFACSVHLVLKQSKSTPHSGSAYLKSFLGSFCGARLRDNGDSVVHIDMEFSCSATEKISYLMCSG